MRKPSSELNRTLVLRSGPIDDFADTKPLLLEASRQPIDDVVVCGMPQHKGQAPARRLSCAYDGHTERA